MKLIRSLFPYLTTLILAVIRLFALFLLSTTILWAVPITSSIPLGFTPGVVTTDSANNRIYVVDLETSQIRVIDGVTGSLLANSFPVDFTIGEVTDLVVDGMRHRLFVSYFCGGCAGYVQVFDIDTYQEVSRVGPASGAHGMAINPDSGRLYVAIEGTYEVWVLYPNGAGSYSLGKTIPGFGDKPNDVTYDRLHQRLYASIHHANEVAVVDTSTETLINTVPVLAGNPTSVAVNPNNRHVYVGQNLGNQISVVDGATETALPNITLGEGPVLVDVDPTTARVFVGLRDSQSVGIIDGNTDTFLAPLLPINGVPTSISVNTADHCAYVVVSGQKSLFKVCDGTPTTYPLTVAKTGSGSGTVNSTPSGLNCGAVCSANYPIGTAVTLTAAAADESTFTGWSGGGCSGTSTCVVTITADTNITATFVLKTYTVSGRVTDSSNGSPLSGVTISSTPGNIPTTTDNNGYYTLGGLQKAIYSFTPYKSGYVFSPVSRSVSVSSNVTNLNFQGVTFYSVSGRVIDENRNPISGVRVLSDDGKTILTDSSGSFALQVMAGPRTFTISKAGYTFVPVSSRVSVSANISGLIFKGYNKPPIIMVHGWNSTADGTFNEGWGPNVPDALVQAGYHVEKFNLDTNFLYTPSFDENVLRLVAAINKAKAATGQPKVIVVAHSMGGLVSRTYIEGPGYRDDVSALYTFGSPHLGTLIVEDRVFLSYLIGGIAGVVVGSGGPGVLEMSIVGMSFFNRDHQRRANVDYHVIGGDAPMDVAFRYCFLWWCWDGMMPTWLGGHAADRNFTGWILGNMIPGQDDAFVSTDSATGLSGRLDRASTNEVHGSLFGCYTYFNYNGIFSCSGQADLSRSYRQCLKKVLVDKTTNTCGRRDSGSRVPLAAAAAVKLEGRTSLAEGGSPTLEESLPSLAQHTPIATGTLRAGQEKTHTLQIEGGVTAFAAHWTSGSVAVTLIDLNGQTIDPAFAASHPDVVQYGADNSTAIYYFRNAIAGKWQLLLKGGSDITAEGSGYSAFAIPQSTLTISSQMDRVWYAAGDTARISAVFSEPPASAKVTAIVLYSDGSSNAVTLSPNGRGQYEASFAVTDVPGYTQVRLEASGIKADGAPFERGQALLFQISPHSAALNGIYRDQPDPRPEEPSLYQALNVTVGITAVINGRIGLSADLVDANGSFVAHSMAIEEVTAGTNNLVLHFLGADIFAAQRNGPYYLTNLLLTDHREATLAVAEARDAYTTGAYDYRAFAERHDFPTAGAGGPYSVDEGNSLTLTAVGNDPENDPLTFAWDLDDDGIFETPGQSVTFSAERIDGPSANSYIIRVRVTDSNGFSAIDQTTLDVMNVAPVVDGGSDATIQLGEVFSRSGSFTDPGPDTWTATVDYGDGTGVQPLPLAGTGFELNHRYSDIGTHPVTVTVSDDDEGTGTATFTVTVSKLPGDLDGDGVPDKVDACPYSNLSTTVVIDNCDTGVTNTVGTNGCTVIDQIGRCAMGAKNHGQFVSCVSQLTDDLKKKGMITGQEKGAIQSCAAQASIP